MILTRTYLNIRRSGARKLLGSPQAMHAAVLSSFPPGVEAGRELWRVDFDDPLRPTLYVLSRERPDLTHIEEQAGWPNTPQTQSASYLPFLESLEAGQLWAFRMRANPAHRAVINGRKQIVAHATSAHQTAWLSEKATGAGISVMRDGEPTFAVTRREMLSFRRQGETVSIGVAQYEGVLEVTDPVALRNALVEGIGRAKAYGCGLMTLARP